MSAPRLPSVIGVSVHRHTVTSIPLGDGHIVNIIQDAKTRQLPTIERAVSEERMVSPGGADARRGRRGMRASRRRRPQATCRRAKQSAVNRSACRTSGRVSVDHGIPRRRKNRERTSCSLQPLNPCPRNGTQATYFRRTLAKWPQTSPDSAQQKTSQGSPSSVRP
jgi:hypothetical protein